MLKYLTALISMLPTGRNSGQNSVRRQICGGVSGNVIPVKKSRKGDKLFCISFSYRNVKPRFMHRNNFSIHIFTGTSFSGTVLVQGTNNSIVD
jgi:hypothetical protein